MIKPYGYVNAEYLKRAAETMSGIKQKSYGLLQLAHARKVLDAGCGPGVDTVAIAKLAPQGTQVIGIDIDPEMLLAADTLAREQHVSDSVSHVLADVYDLPFEDRYFDACRAERLFQNIPATHDFRAVLDELLRVLQSGGRIVLIDPDYGSASVDVDDAALERKMMHYCATHVRPNGLVARRFYEMLKHAGVNNVEVHIETLVFTKVEDSPFGTYLTDAARNAKYISEAEGVSWMEMLTKREQTETFFSTLNILTISGTKD